MNKPHTTAKYVELPADPGAALFNADQFTLSRNGAYVADASDLELPAGEIPASIYIRIDGRHHHFLYSGHDSHGTGPDAGETAGWRYTCVTRSGLRALIIND